LLRYPNVCPYKKEKSYVKFWSREKLVVVLGWSDHLL